MRKFLQAFKAVIIVTFALGCAVFSLLLTRSPVFERGESYELYHGANSSSLLTVTDRPVYDKLLFQSLAGESVRYTGNRYEALKTRFRARLLFTEEAAGVTNYYLYSPLLGSGVALAGYSVNLHVAVSETQTAAGTPLIFGGF